ncbi:helix-turn-helix domain-containing protein [Donghicola sp. XS_ASV15]|uniref:arsenate reductase/protein-tyrosine-phosphatase family protein n=1 Tax=Donghicola sp. XS_ASV15 TaxID=3241295 RepID=UPI0035196565
MEKMIPDRLAILGHPARLALFRLLMRRYPDRLPAGEIAGALDLKASTLSTYLSSLMQVGLVTQQRAGTSLMYSVDMETVRQTFDYLLIDCCRGRPEMCAPVPVPQTSGKRSVLFLCTGNSARSIMAEAILRDMAGDRFKAYSAGTHPRDSVNPNALQALEANGITAVGLSPKHMDAFYGHTAPEMDFVFTVCNHAANEECPTWEGQPINGHWGLPDPSSLVADGADMQAAFQQTFIALRQRIAAFVQLRLDSMDRIAMQSAVDFIARLPEDYDA